MKVRTRLEYDDLQGGGDIDLIMLDESTREMLVAQVKAFIPPDTAVEVISANEKLEDGVAQLLRAKTWIEAGGRKRLLDALGTRLGFDLNNVVLAVLGNGFAGSDYVEVPAGVHMANADFLLMPRYRGGSPVDAIDDFDNAVAMHTTEAEASGFHRLVLGEVTIDSPE